MSLKEQAEALGIKVDGRWSDKRIQEEIKKATPDVPRETPEAPVTITANSINETTIAIIPPEEPRTTSDFTISITVDSDKMNNLAMRIWEGQSISLPEKERVTRIIKALREKGYEDLSNLDLPVDMSRYI